MIERRAHPRFSAVEYRVWMGWWNQPEEFVAIAAQVDNISLGGARIVTTNPPIPAQDVWMRLGGSTASECVRATVLEVCQQAEGDYTVRLAFTTTCPDDFYRTVVDGLSGFPEGMPLNRPEERRAAVPL